MGIFSLGCDEDCTVYMMELFNKRLIKWLEKIEIVYFLSIKDKVKIENLDIALIEGVVNTKKERLKRLLELIIPACLALLIS